MSHPLAKCLTECGPESVFARLSYREQTSGINLLEIWKEMGKDAWSSHLLQMDTVSLKHRLATQNLERITFIIRIVGIPVLRTSGQICLDVQERQYQQAVDTLGLRNIHELAHTSPMSFDVIPQYQHGTLTDVECSVFISRFVGLYSAHRSSKVTQSLVWCDKLMLDHLEMTVMNLIDLGQHPLHLLLAGMITLTSHVDHELTRIHAEILHVGERTGHHQWGGLPEAAARGSLPNLSAIVSGHANSLALQRRNTKLSSEILAAYQMLAKFEGTIAPTTRTSLFCLEPTYFAILDRRLRNQFSQLDVIEARVRIQLTAQLFNLVTSQETNQNLEIAKDSKTIANAARRDSSSMKILAAVTVFFLPATFIASLFSTSMFDWNITNGSVVSPRFWVYWATVIPLTLITMVICFLLSQRWSDLAQREDEQAVEDLSASPENEKFGQPTYYRP